eukprot:jgi/Tetstr1/440243/TSEL_028594.t1
MSSSGLAGEGREEQFLFRCHSAALAARIQAVLRKSPSAKSEDYNMDIKWAKDREGVFKIGGDEFPCQLLDLPTVIETYKTYNDANLVKSADIGQVVIIREKGSDRISHQEARHGLTPPARDARKRHFRPAPPRVDQFVVEEVEADLASILGGHGLEGIRYDDVEEVWVEDEDGNGEWQRVTSKTSAMPAPREVFKKLPPTGRRSSKKATSNLLLAGDDIMEEI